MFKYKSQCKNTDKYKKRFSYVNNDFINLESILDKNYNMMTVNGGIVADLGVSSIQLDDKDRGFSFNKDGPLDMRMSNQGISAQDLIYKLDEKDLAKIFWDYGDEKKGRAIARLIVKERTYNNINTTFKLVNLIKRVKKNYKKSKHHPATKTFQALRIFVNKEITELVKGLISATKILRPGGKIFIISFHSIEDKIIKYLFSNYSKNKSKSSRYFPENNSNSLILFEDYKNKILRPSKEEIFKNIRSRSAKLRFATRSANKFEYPKEFLQKFKKYLDLEAINV